MTRVKKTVKWMVPAAMLLLLAMIFTGLPVHAAGEGEEPDTTGTTEASVSFEAGELRLESAPVLDFGLRAISHEEQEHEAVSASPKVQVSDLRGNGSGWDLLVSLSPFLLEEGGSATLKAASISFASPQVSAVNGTVGSPPKAGASVTLPSDGTQTPVWKAEANEGMGVWSLGWNTSDIKLKVKPGTAEEGKSVATITWSLQATP